MRALLLLLATSTAATTFAVPEAFEVGPGNKDQLPRGKEADGIIGDFILRNDRIEAVISGNLPLRRANMSTFYDVDGITPGNLYDLTLRGANNDQLTCFQPAAQQGLVSWVRVSNDTEPGEAAIEVMATGPTRDGIAKRHVFSTRDGWQGVLVSSQIMNEGKEAKKVLVTDKFTSFWRTGIAPVGTGIMWADAVDPADRAGYAAGFLEAPDDIGTNKLRELKPGESLTLVRFVAVAASPAEAVGIVAAQQGSTSKVSGKVSDERGAPIAGAQIVVRTATPPPPITTNEPPPKTPPRVTAATTIAAQTNRAMGIGYTDAQGSYSFALPDGRYRIAFNDQGRGGLERELNLENDLPVDVTLPSPAAIAFKVRDENGVSIPCKAQFLAKEGTMRVNLGPEQRAHGCRDQWHNENGDFRVQLAPGNYRVVVTHGIEYSHAAQDVTLKANETFAFNATLKRLVDTRGWVSADYHNHSTPSGDNTCGTDDRVINLAAEHIEFAPTTEHNRLYDWRPHIDRLGLAKFINTVPGMELTGEGAHQNSFPFKPVPFTQDNGAPVWNKDPRITAITLRGWQDGDPDRWIQINHPDMTANFNDQDGDGRHDGGFRGLSTLIDGIETQNYRASELLGGQPYKIGRDAKGKEAVQEIREFVWLQMLNRGHRYAAMAVNDAHSVWGNGVGGWRMYLPSASDEPDKIDWRENSRAAKAGRSYLTTGPFLQVTTDDGTGPGGMTRTLNGAVKLKVRVQCTDWLDIDRVAVLVNGRVAQYYTREKDAARFKAGVVKFEETLEVKLSEDAHLIVAAFAELSDLRIGYGTSGQRKVKPFAYHNPILVDVDGHGFTPNNDTLDWPLPVKKIKVEDAKKMLTERGFDAGPPEIETEL